MTPSLRVSSRSAVLVSIAALSVIAKIITDQNLFLFLFLIVSGYGIFKEEIEGKIIFLLFFLPWIYTLKFGEGGFTLFHIIQLLYLLSCVLSMSIKREKISHKVMLGILFLTFYILINSAYNSTVSLVVVIGFLINFLSVAFALSTIKNRLYLKRYVHYYTSGLALSGAVALLGDWIPNVKENIQSMGESYTVFQNNHLYTRFSGMDIDPNYFSFQVLFAVSLLLVISSNNKSNIKEKCLILVLAFMGINTLSKMFFLLLILVIFYTYAVSIRNQLMNTYKSIIELMVGLLILLPLGLYDFIVATLSRFSNQGNSVVSVTTGRSDLWLAYIEEIITNPRVFLVGKGIGSNFLNGFAAHNMYLTYWYFMGLAGVIALMIFIIYSYSQLGIPKNTNSKRLSYGLNKLPLYVLIVANFSLDSILMDFFPLLLFLTLMSMKYTVEELGDYEGTEIQKPKTASILQASAH